MDAAVGDQALHGDAGDLAPHRVEARQGDGLGGIVDDEIHAGQRLDGADVSALAADDTALHLIVGQRHHRDCGLGNLIGSHPLNGVRNHIAGTLIGFALELGLKFRQLNGLFVLQLGAEAVEQVFLGLILGEAGQALQQLILAFFQCLNIRDAGIGVLVLLAEGLFLLFIVLDFAVQSLFLLLQTALLPLHIGAALLELLFGLVAQTVDLVLGLEDRLFFGGLRLGMGLPDNALGFGLCGADLGFCFFFAMVDAGAERKQRRHQRTDDQRARAGGDQNR